MTSLLVVVAWTSAVPKVMSVTRRTTASKVDGPIIVRKLWFLGSSCGKRPIFLVFWTHGLFILLYWNVSNF